MNDFVIVAKIKFIDEKDRIIVGGYVYKGAQAEGS